MSRNDGMPPIAKIEYIPYGQHSTSRDHIHTGLLNKDHVYMHIDNDRTQGPHICVHHVKRDVQDKTVSPCFRPPDLYKV